MLRVRCLESFYERAPTDYVTLGVGGSVPWSWFGRRLDFTPQDALAAWGFAGVQSHSHPASQATSSNVVESESNHCFGL